MPPVQVNLNVAVDTSGNVSVFGSPPPSLSNIIVPSTTLPITALYNAQDNSLIKFKQSASDVNSISALRDSAFSTPQSSLEAFLKSILNGSFNASVSLPFSTYSEQYHTYPSFGKLALSSYAHSLFGHVAATAAIDNDTSFVNSMNGDDLGQAALNKLLANAIYNMTPDIATPIAQQVIGQDSSRAKFENNDSEFQALQFKNGDTIYLSISLLPPSVSSSNSAQQSIPLNSNHSTQIYFLQISLWDGTGTKPTNNPPSTSSSDSSGSGESSGSTSDVITLSYSTTHISYDSTSSTYNLSVGNIMSPMFASRSWTVGAQNTLLSNYMSSPALPPGLFLDPSSGTITGTPTEEVSTTEYTISATNAVNAVSSTTIKINTYIIPVTGVSNITSTLSTYDGGDGSVLMYIGPNETSIQLNATPVPPNASEKTITFDWYSAPLNTTITLSTNGLITFPADAGSHRDLEPFASNTNGDISRIFIKRHAPPANAVLLSTGTTGYGTATPPTPGFFYTNATTRVTTVSFPRNLPLRSHINALYAVADLPVTAGTYSISPALPSGMTIDSFNGYIGGTPTVFSGPTVYTITGVSGAKTRTTTLTISVV